MAIRNRYAFTPESTPEVTVNGRPLPLLKWDSDSWESGDEESDEGHGWSDGAVHVIRLVIDRPEPTELVTVGATVSIQIGDTNPATYRVTGAREDYLKPKSTNQWFTVYRIALTEDHGAQPAMVQPDDTIEVLYRSAFMAVRTHTLLRALAELLKSKGVFASDELWKQFDSTTRSSFLDLALDIVAEDEAKAMAAAAISDLDATLMHPEEIQSVP